MAAVYENKAIDRERWRAVDFDFNTGIHPYRGDITTEQATAALVAWDVKAQKIGWKVPLPGLWNGGTLATAGNLVLQGTSGGKLHAYRADSGLPLWSFDVGVGVSAPPITYAVDGKQYIAILAGWGGAGYIGSSAFAQHQWRYMAQPRRLLVFSLEGKAELPPAPAMADLEFIDDPKQAIDLAQAEAGQDIFLESCWACHGMKAKASGGAPDLRASAIAADQKAFAGLLRSGALQERGMPIYDDLSEREVEQVYWFIRQMARESL